MLAELQWAIGQICGKFCTGPARPLSEGKGVCSITAAQCGVVRAGAMVYLSLTLACHCSALLKSGTGVASGLIIHSESRFFTLWPLLESGR